MLGVFLDRDSLDRGDLDFSMLDNLNADWQFFGQTLPEDLQSRIASASIIITNKVVLDAKAMAAAPHLKLICVAATGYNNVDIAAARERGIQVCNVRGYATPSVTQHVFALLLSLTTQLGKYRRAVMRGDWQESHHFCLLDYPIEELAGKTLGIIGYGELGKSVANVAKAIGMKVIISQRPGGIPQAGRVDLDQLLQEADVVSLHCPLTPDTEGLIGRDQLRSMKSNALLINTARGGIVDEAALADALRDGYIAGAGVDVLSEEPPRQNPLLEKDIPNLIVTPHIAWASRSSRQRLLNEIGLNIQAFLDNQPRNLVEA